MRFTEYLRTYTDICCPVMLELTKQHGWSEQDQQLQDAIAAGDDAAARRLVIENQLFDAEDLRIADDFCRWN